MSDPRIVRNQLPVAYCVDWNQWSFIEYNDPDNILSYSISGDGTELTITIDAAASSSNVRMLAARTISTKTGFTNALSLEVTAISGDWTNLDIAAVTASGVTSGSALIATPTAVGRVGAVFELGADDSDIFRVGIGCNGVKNVTGAKSITLRFPQFENDLPAGTAAPSEFTPSGNPSAFSYELGNTLSGNDIIEAQGAAIANCNTKKVIMLISDSQGNYSNELKGELEALLDDTYCVMTDGVAGRTLSDASSGSVQANISDILDLQNVTLNDLDHGGLFSASAIRPHQIWINLGVNDILQTADQSEAQTEYGDALDAVYAAIPFGGELVINEITPFEGSASGTAARTTTCKALNSDIRTFCSTRRNCHYVPLYDLAEDQVTADNLRSDWDSGDGIHHNNTGHAAIAAEAFDYFQILAGGAAGAIRTRTVNLYTITGTQDIIIPGAFGENPKGCMVIFGGYGDGDKTAAVFGIGFTDGTNEFSVCVNSLDATSSTVTRRSFSNTSFCLCLEDSYDATDYEFAFDSWLTDGVRINITTASASSRSVTFIFFGGSLVENVHAGSLDMGAVPSTIDYTSPGFEPSLVFSLSHCSSTIGVSSPLTLGFGAAHNDGSDTQKHIGLWDITAVTTTDTGGHYSTTAAIGQAYNGAITWRGTISGFDSSGFSITTTGSNPVNDVAAFLSVKLSNSVNVSLDDVDSPTSTGDFSVTTGFKPTFSMMLMSGTTTSDVAQDGAGDLSVSVFDASSESCMTFSSETGVAPSNTTSRYTSSAVADLTSGKTDLHNGTFSSFNNDGFTLNFPTDVAGTARNWAVLTVSEGSDSKSFFRSIFSEFFTDINSDVNSNLLG